MSIANLGRIERQFRFKIQSKSDKRTVSKSKSCLKPKVYQSFSAEGKILLLKENKLINYFAIFFSFSLMFTNNWFPYCAMALCIVSVYYLSQMKQ